MGTDAHLASKSKQFTATLNNGQTITVAPLVFLCKARDLDETASFFVSQERQRRINLRNAMISRVEQAWGDQGPEYVILTYTEGKPQDGVPVLRRETGRPVLVFDSDTLGESVGVLRKVGRRWTILSNMELTRLGGKLLHAFTEPRPYTKPECAAILGMSEDLTAAVLFKLQCHGLVQQRFDFERKVEAFQATDKGQESRTSDDLSAYWADLVPVAS